MKEMMGKFKKKSTRWIAVLAAMVLIGMFATGCGSQGQAPQEETTAATVATTPAATEAATEATTAAPQTSQQATPAAGQEFIGEEKALQIALQDAGKAETDVGYPLIHLDFDDGIHKYEVQFNQGTTEWNYDIDATTGAILEKDMDNEID